jgi:hypothetical protein
MKSILALSLALSAVAATSAFATPQQVASHAQVAVVQDGTQFVRDLKQPVAADGSERVIARQHDDHAPIYVAEVRHEFGSRYQRY